MKAEMLPILILFQLFIGHLQAQVKSPYSLTKATSNALLFFNLLYYVNEEAEVSGEQMLYNSNYESIPLPVNVLQSLIPNNDENRRQKLVSRTICPCWRPEMPEERSCSWSLATSQSYSEVPMWVDVPAHPSLQASRQFLP